MMGRLARSLILLLALLVATSVHARPTSEFDQHVAEGRRLYAERDFDKALIEFNLAYGLDPDPRLLLNMGRCHFMAGRPAEALNFYKQVLNQKLTDEHRNDVMKSVKKAIDKIEEQQRAAAAVQKSNSPTHVDAAPLLVSPPAPPPKPIYRKGWFWGIIGGVTVVGLAVGLGLGLGLRSSSAPSPVDVIQ